jgi:hypothetical protein
MNDEFKVGDRVWTPRDGAGKVDKLDSSDINHPVWVRFDDEEIRSFARTGRWWHEQADSARDLRKLKDGQRVVKILSGTYDVSDLPAGYKFPIPPAQHEDRGLRFNSGKPQLTFNHLSIDCEVAEAKVWEAGAKKYSPGNWLKGSPVMEGLDSVNRHLTKFVAGYDVDPENGCLHLAEAITGLKIVLHSYLKDPKRFDNRVAKGLIEPWVGALDGKPE